MNAACEAFQAHPKPHDDGVIRRFVTGSQSLDRALFGGIACGKVTEIAGRSNTGKTQLCMTLAALVGRSGRGIVYVSSNAGSRGRLVEILRTRGCDSREVRKVTEKIAFASVLSTLECVELLENLSADVSAMRWYPDEIDPGDGMGPAAAKELVRCLGLVIVDSLSGILKPELGSDSGMSGMNALRRILERLAEETRCAVVTVNTFTDSKEGGPKLSFGKSWLGLPDTRITLEQKHSLPTDIYQSSNGLHSEADVPDLELSATVLAKNNNNVTSCDVCVGKTGLYDGS